jgi:hypothetical protein
MLKTLRDIARAKNTPISAWIFSITYMALMHFVQEWTKVSAISLIWMITAIPLFWLWTLAVWRLQKHRLLKENSIQGAALSDKD